MTSWYHEDIKKQFMESLDKESERLFAIALFNGVASLEYKYDCDICDFSKSMLIATFNTLEWNNYSTFIVYRCALKSYTDWCIKCKISTVDSPAAANFEFDSLVTAADYSSKYFHSEESFLECIKIVTQDAGFYVMPIAYLCFAWLGFDRKQVALIKKEAVDFEARTVTLDGVYTATNVSEGILSYLKMAIDQIEYDPIGVTIFPEQKAIVLAESPYILRRTNQVAECEPTPVTSATLNNMSQKILRAKECLKGYDAPIMFARQKSLSYKDVMFAGRACKLRQWEENHEEATIKNRHSWAKALNLWDSKRQLAKYKAYSFFQTYQIWRKENQNDIIWK